MQLSNQRDNGRRFNSLDSSGYVSCRKTGAPCLAAAPGCPHRAVRGGDACFVGQ
jgi:hypothetical protein